MDVREKLVELVHNARINALWHNAQKPDEYITDMLMEDGVTVRKWIQVDERLPKNFISVLGYMTDAGEFPPVRECYTVGNAFFFPSLGDVHPVSHWCEMPEPPKGE